MATIKSYTDIEQSRNLAKFLPVESADMYYNLGESKIPNIIYGNIADFKCYIPCWSLSTLLSVLPKIQGGKPVIALDDNYITYPHTSCLYTKADSLVNACYKLILKLYELKML